MVPSPEVEDLSPAASQDKTASPTAGEPQQRSTSALTATSCSPTLASAKTTMLSARSQIEILNPNEPAEHGVFDSKKSPLALLAATCSNIGRDSNMNGFPPGPYKSPPSPNEIKLTSPHSRSSRLNSETGGEPKTPGTPPSLIKYMEKLSPGSAAASSDLAQLQAKFSSYHNSVTSSAPSVHTISDLYDPSKFAAQLQAKAAAAAAAYMFPLPSLSSSLGAQHHQSSPGSAGGCHLCPSSSIVVGGGHSPSKPGAGSPYTNYQAVKTQVGNIVHVPVCDVRNCLHCLTAVRQAMLLSTTPNCTHCSDKTPSAPAFNPSLFHLQALQQNSLFSSLAASSDKNHHHSINSLVNPQSFMATLAAAAAAAQKEHNQQQGDSCNLPNKCKWAPAGGQPCGKSFATESELMDHIKSAHMSGGGSPTEEASRRHSPVTSTPGAAAAGFPPSSMSALQTANSLLSLSSLSRKMPGSMDLACALGAAARFHPYQKLPGSVAPPVSSFSGITPASLNALLSSVGSNPYMLYDLPKA